jgi:phosphomannomutase
VNFLDSGPLHERVRRWINQDPDPLTKASLEDSLKSAQAGSRGEEANLQRLFSTRLAFGTAGIRGTLGPGPAGMNRVVVAQTTAGFALFLQRNLAVPGGRRLRVVVGCDARTNSEVFMQDTAEVLSGHGIEVLALPTKLPTPIVSFAVRNLVCDAGIMITASHNPPTDNGYKVYLGGFDEGSQIVPPTDKEIEKHITRVAESLSWSDITRSIENIRSAPEEILESYISQTITAVGTFAPPAPTLKVVYTPLHGVGAETFMALLDAAGFPRPHVVEEQVKPDPNFPTVSFPNPEEKSALDLAYAKGRSFGAQLILAHDPDADRLAVAVEDNSQDGGYRMFAGNQLGAILGWWAAERASLAGQTGALANSLASSPVLSKIAQHFGFDHAETLTGFKYVSRVPDLIFGFEEAIGYLVAPSVVRDKDGISAGLAVLDLAYRLAAENKTLDDYLANIENHVGAFSSGQITIRLDEASSKTPLTTSFRESPPDTVGLRAVTRLDDFQEGVEGFPKDDIIRLMLDDGSRVIVRPSGTEPKLKIYIDTTGETRADAERTLSEVDSDLRELVTARSTTNP